MNTVVAWAVRHEKSFKLIVSIVFGLSGFVLNFQTILLPVGAYTVAVLVGLLFPLLITLSWGWKYGLLSALAGGCQSMWWLWGPSNGYAVIPAVLPFTLWIVWHGVVSELRKKPSPKWWMNLYVSEIALSGLIHPLAAHAHPLGRFPQSASLGMGGKCS